MIKNYWLQQAEEEEDIRYFRNKLFNPLRLPDKFLLEAKECHKRWQENGLLEGIETIFTRRRAAVLLEGQRLINEKKGQE